MNAYELADELENYVWMNPNNNRDYCKEVKDMLRQQADRIVELEDRLSMYEIKDLDRGLDENRK
jgi:ABC-type Zn uptake system ZnuABC Zn-binding protein ZnuA